jgi:hypothetical protein
MKKVVLSILLAGSTAGLQAQIFEQDFNLSYLTDPRS